ncbi:MAG: hypothetical protein C4581_07310 [Nitrospiraceae bacterium]|nr:MAG: hypothetical protein C4581_07310 [Nitrospiraceae bacterium]
MILEEINNIKSEKKDLRNFGITFGIFLGILAGALWWKGKDTYFIFVFLSLIFFFFGLVLPALLKPLQKAWMIFAVILGWFMTRVILSFLFFVVFTSIGLLSKLFGNKFLDLKIVSSEKSYWIPRKTRLFDKSNYEKQF